MYFYSATNTDQNWNVSQLWHILSGTSASGQSLHSKWLSEWVPLSEGNGPRSQRHFERLEKKDFFSDKLHDVKFILVPTWHTIFIGYFALCDYIFCSILFILYFLCIFFLHLFDANCTIILTLLSRSIFIVQCLPQQIHHIAFLFFSVCNSVLSDCMSVFVDWHSSQSVVLCRSMLAPLERSF